MAVQLYARPKLKTLTVEQLRFTVWAHDAIFTNN